MFCCYKNNCVSEVVLCLSTNFLMIWYSVFASTQTEVPVIGLTKLVLGHLKIECIFDFF